jgi:hypothetical protein
MCHRILSIWTFSDIFAENKIRGDCEGRTTNTGGARAGAPVRFGEAQRATAFYRRRRLRQTPASGKTIVLTAMSHALAADAARARRLSAANR